MELSPLAWLSIGLILAALEILAPGFVVFWFGIGGVLTALLVLMGLLESAEAQWLFFFISSASLVGLWFGVLKKRFHPDESADSRDPTITGLHGRCTRRITPTVPGEVELYENFHGLRTWQAESPETIEEGDEVTVADAKGIKLVVMKKR
jgi:membrane protein implicated in regulation of membrane protease activity